MKVDWTDTPKPRMSIFKGDNDRAGDWLPCDKDIIKLDEKEYARVKAIERKYGSAMGDCFRKNYAEFQRLVVSNPHLKFVIIELRYRVSKRKIRHAVCYDGDTQIDISQGWNIRIDRCIFEDPSYDNGDKCPQYDILAHKVFGKDDIPSLDFIIDRWGSYRGYEGEELIKGSVPKLKGRWDAAAALVI